MNDFFKKGFKFIDLFAGIGGFHQAMKLCNGTCVFAAEISEETAQTYKNNYGIEALHDVTKIDPNEIPQHDVLCAGFPCQSFSKAGKQKGFNDIRGTLFFDIIRILQAHIKSYGGKDSNQMLIFVTFYYSMKNDPYVHITKLGNYYENPQEWEIVYDGVYTN